MSLSLFHLSLQHLVQITPVSPSPPSQSAALDNLPTSSLATSNPAAASFNLGAVAESTRVHSPHNPNNTFGLDNTVIDMGPKVPQPTASVPSALLLPGTTLRPSPPDANLSPLSATLPLFSTNRPALQPIQAPHAKLPSNLSRFDPLSANPPRFPLMPAGHPNPTSVSSTLTPSTAPRTLPSPIPLRGGPALDDCARYRNVGFGFQYPTLG